VSKRVFILILLGGILGWLYLMAPGMLPHMVEASEQGSNAGQPPDKVMDAIGVKPGMVIGEVGAGRGRYTVHLARRVGTTGRIYANDINETDLNYLRDRCRQDGIKNVEIIVGKVEDPLFPKDTLDMAFMILTYHHLSRPVALLKNIIPCLKPGATVVIVDPDPDKNRGSPAQESTSPEKMRREAAEAGFEIARTETFLVLDNIFILRLKTF
jgi:SAM-dependent methyltransferase